MEISTIIELNEILKERQVKIMETCGESAVLIPFVEKEGGLYLLFEVRSDLVSQPGEVCFPGGMLMEKERPRDCAVRETNEELGIPKHRIRILEAFDILHNYTNMTIHSFVGTISNEDVKAIKMNEEVQDIFMVPLKFFLENDPYIYEYKVIPQIGDEFPYHMLDFSEKYRWRTGTYIVPIFQYDGKTIWGITARILCHLLETLKNG